MDEKQKANQVMQARLDAIYQRQEPHYRLNYDAGVLQARTHMRRLRTKSREQQQLVVAQKHHIYKQRLAAVKAYYTGPQRRAGKDKTAELPERPQSAGS